MQDKMLGAILIDSKKTWKLITSVDPDLKVRKYREVKNLVFIVGERDDEVQEDYTFVTAAEFGRKYNQVGTLIFHMATKK